MPFASPPPRHAETILRNGVIHTLDPRRPRAEALAIARGRILAVGSNGDAEAVRAPATRAVELAGRTVVPGFCDTHGHIGGLGRALQWLDLSGTRSFEELIARVAARARETPPGRWIFGSGWDQTAWPEKAFPPHGRLSSATPGHPVWLRRMCGHAWIANARAMEAAGVGPDVQAPPGGEIPRDERGDPLGVFIDSAIGLVGAAAPPPTEAERRQAIALALEHCARLGLAALHDAGAEPWAIRRYAQLADEGALAPRVFAMAGWASSDPMESGAPARRRPGSGEPPGFDYADFIRRGPYAHPSGLLAVRCVKALADGSLGAASAAMLEPYIGQPNNRGVLCMERQAIARLVRETARAGMQCAIHAIGDRANRLVLDALEEAMRERPERRALRPRIEHAQHLAPDDLPRLGRLGVIPAMQPSHAMCDMETVERLLGPERARGAYAFRSLIDSGAFPVSGSDFPVADADPIYGMHCLVNRADRQGRPAGGWRIEEAMTREEALRSYTSEAARAAFAEEELGSIEIGKRADLAVLTRDILAGPAQEMLQTRVCMTIVDGRIVHEA